MANSLTTYGDAKGSSPGGYTPGTVLNDTLSAKPASSVQSGYITPAQTLAASGIPQNKIQEYQTKYPGANMDALVGSILMDNAKNPVAPPAPTKSPAPVIATSDLANDTANKQVTDLKSMQGSAGSYDSPEAAKAAGFGGSLGYNPTTGKYEPLEALQAKQSTAPAGLTTDQAKAKASSGFESSLDTMSMEILKQLQARPGSIDLATQNQIKQIQEVMGARRTETEKLNEAQSNAMKTIGITSGQSRYAPTVQAGVMTDVAVQGLKRVQAIDDQQQQLISEALSQAEEKKFTALNQTYEFITKLKDQKAQALKDVAQAAKASRDEQIAQENHDWARITFMDTQLDKGIDRMAKASADGSFTPNEDDFKVMGEAYGYSPEAIKGMFGVSADAIAMKNAKDVAEYKSALTNAATGLWTALDKVPAGQAITIDGHQYFGTQGTGKTEIDPNGMGYQFSIDQQTGAVERVNLGYVGKKEEGWETKADDNGKMWRINANTNQMVPMFVGDLTKTFSTLIPDGNIGTKWRDPSDPNAGQCGANANDCYANGKVWRNTIDEKLADAVPFEVPKNEVRVGDSLVISAGTTGHVAIVNQVETKDGKTVLRLSESNWKEDLKQTNDRPLQLNDPSILKVARIPLRQELLSGPDAPTVTSQPTFGAKTAKLEESKPLTASEAENWAKQGYTVKAGDTLADISKQNPNLPSASKNTEKAFNLKTKIADIDSLLANKTGLQQAVGPTWFARGAQEAAYGPLGGIGTAYAVLDPSAKQNFAAGVRQLISKETLDALTNLKAQGGTLGALSDGEKQMLQSAASKIGGWMLTDSKDKPTGYFEASEKDFSAELEKLRSLTSRAYAKAVGLDQYGKDTGFDVAKARAGGWSDEEILNNIH